MTGGATHDPEVREIEALDAASSAYVRALQEEHALPDLVKARVARRLRDAPSARRGRELWALVGLAAAAALVLIASSDLLPRGREGAASRSVSADAASYSREAEAAALAVIRGEQGRRGAGALEQGEVGIAGSAEHGAGGGEAGASVGGGEAGASVGGGEAGASVGGGEAGASVGSGEAGASVGGRDRGASTGRGGGAEMGGRSSAGVSAREAGSRSSGASAQEADTKARGREAPELDLAGERRTLEGAWRALKGGDLQGALAGAKEHRERYPAGALTQEREAIEVIARCRGGAPGAKAAVEAFGARFGQSPWMAQIRAACS